MTNSDNHYVDLEKLYKKLYSLAEKLEEYALAGKAEPEELKKIHYKVYNLKDEALSSWLDIKKKISD